MVTNPQDSAATLAMLKMMSPVVDDPRYAYEVRDALDNQGSRDGDGGVRVHAGAADHCRSSVMGVPVGTWDFHHQPSSMTFDYEWSLQNDEGAFCMFDFHPLMQPDEQLATATLLAAAKDILEALKDCAESLALARDKLGMCGEGDGKDRRANAEDTIGSLLALHAAHAAISKAEGK